jgi:hypothetical protein
MRYGVPTIIKDFGKDIFNITDRYINVVIPFNLEVLKHFGTINGTIKNELSEKNSLVNYLIRNPKATYNNCSSNMKISSKWRIVK